MSVKINDVEMYEVCRSINAFCNGAIAVLDDIEAKINTLVQNTTISGTTADNIKTYLGETHTMLIMSLKTYLLELSTKQTLYIDYVTGLDSHSNAVLDTEILDQCVEDFSELKSSFDTNLAAMKAVFGEVMDILDVYSEYASLNGYAGETEMNDKFTYASMNVDFLSVVLEDHNRREYDTFVEPLQSNGDTIDSLITEMRGKSMKDISEYKPGDIADYEYYDDVIKEMESSAKYLVNNYDEDLASDVYEDQFEFQFRKGKLFVDMLHSGYKTVKDISSAIGNYAKGATLLYYIQPSGVVFIGKGVQDTTSALDNAWGTLCYFKAIITNDVHYEHVSGEDYAGEMLTDLVFDGDEETYESAKSITDTTISTTLDAGEVYYKTESVSATVGYVIYKVGVEEVIVPTVVSDELNDQISETTYIDLQEVLGEHYMEDMEKYIDVITVNKD